MISVTSDGGRPVCSAGMNLRVLYRESVDCTKPTPTPSLLAVAACDLPSDKCNVSTL